MDQSGHWTDKFQDIIRLFFYETADLPSCYLHVTELNVFLKVNFLKEHFIYSLIILLMHPVYLAHIPTLLLIPTSLDTLCPLPILMSSLFSL